MHYNISIFENIINISEVSWLNANEYSQNTFNQLVSILSNYLTIKISPNNQFPPTYFIFVIIFQNLLTSEGLIKQTMNDYFIFPVNFEDVEQEVYNRHFTEQIFIPNNEKQILRELKRIDEEILRNNYTDICQHRNFDYLYHLIKLFSQNIEARSMTVLQKISQTLFCTGKTILKQTMRITSEQQLQTLRVSFKMIVFLILYYITVVAKCKLKTTQADMIAEQINKEKRKKNKGGDIQLSKHVIYNMKQLINLLKETLEIDYKILWQRKQVDPEMFKRYTDVCVKILESSIAKDEQVITKIFYIIQVIIKERPELFKIIQTVLINLVYESEMIDTLVNFFSRAESPQLQRLCTQTIITVVVYLCSKNLNSEASSIKNTRQFLSKLSQKIPKVFFNNLSGFIKLYLHESYHLRNAISDILMNILRFVFNNQSQDSQNKSRDKFINTLIQRIYDKSSFCRWHALGILNQLTIQRAIPKKYTIMFLKAGVDRIKDHSVNTRKKALQLINTIIQDVWPEDRTLRSSSILQEELRVNAMSKQSAEQQLEEIKQKIQGEDYQSQTHLQKLTREMNILSKKIYEYERKQLQLAEQQQIITLVNDVLDKVKILLSSKTDTDVLQTIRLFIKFYKRNIEYCKQCLPNIRLLIFSKQKKIKDEVLMTFTQLHLIKRNNQQVAEELVNLFKDASAQDCAALEQILQIIVSQSLLKNIPVIKLSVYALLWHRFVQYQRSQQQNKIAEKRAILTILRIAFNKDPNMIKQQNIASFMAILKNYISTKRPDFYILREILKIIMLDPKTCSIIDVNARNLLLAIICILVNSQESPDQDWYSVSEHLLTCVYRISPNPQKLTQVFIKKLHENVIEKSSSSVSLSHFIFTLSHGCLKMLIHLDSLQNKIKSIKAQDMNQKADDKSKSKNKSNQGEQEEQLDKVVGGVEAEIQGKLQQIQKLGEKIIQDPFISKWVKVVETISNDLQLGNELQIISVLSYCKFMCISPTYCQQQFPNLLKLLNKPKMDSVIKNNIIIAIGDLLHRFPNIVEPYSRYLYQNLHDKDIRVRKTTLTVLTHLALNDMIKVKGDICDIAMLFQDEDPEIESLVKQFFSQVNRKDPKYLFNIIPEALTRFSQRNVSGNSFANDKTFIVFMENVLPLMEKDKYSQSLIIKLCERLANSLNILEIRNTAYCLSQINMNQKGLRKLLQCFSDYKKTLQTPQVLSSFKNLITKLKKSSKGQLKSLIQEFEQKITNANEDVYNADQIKKRNQRNQKKQPKKKGVNTVANRKKGSGNKEEGDENTQSRRKKGAKKASKRNESSDDDDQEMDIQESQSDQVQQVVAQNSQSRSMRPKRVVSNSRKPIILQESQDEDEQDSNERFIE